MAQANLNITELKDFINHIIENNRFLQSKGKLPVATEVLGESGIGKTSTIIEMAKNSNLDFVKVNLSQIEELGDLVGFPVRQFQMYREIKAPTNANLNYTTTKAPVSKKIAEWVDEMAVEQYLKQGYKMTKKNRMSYCAPEWIANKKNGGILLLDDWNRANVRFIQAVMELIDRQTYISWTLPKDWHIILTANPDNGDYNVTSLDPAQKTRFITANLKFDVDVWAKWAEEAEIDTRCINFLLMHPELVTQEVNARAITTFFNSISSFKDFSKNLPMIQLLGEGSVGEEFSSLFTMFINNKLDKIPTPKKLLFEKDVKVMHKLLTDTIGTGNDYRADIASTLATRLANYSVYYSKNNTINQEVTDRLIYLSTKDIFTNDLKYLIVRTIFTGNKSKFNRMMMNSEIIKMTMK